MGVDEKILSTGVVYMTGFIHDAPSSLDDYRVGRNNRAVEGTRFMALRGHIRGSHVFALV